ncbi:DUF3888 domain-containing protein [Paenibacillus sp. N1-5-1-14]|uniref:DUF3888 domain-containing protein n=1 Tax=Paenibacillus radicibacter TaxID=2972488 RepID=UPI002158ECE4|nr:DUF3888 domain-containing protein [Paenibacillus radicibacter]MCR8641656.1 DUF3888 domain-containing protein [Paenibacillus radicibacter]
MKRKSLATLGLSMMLFAASTHISHAQVARESLLLPSKSITQVLAEPDDSYLRAMEEDAIYTLLYPYTQQAIRNEFGGSNRQFQCPTILKITKREAGSYFMEITLQVETFTGAHNPPYHDVILTVNNYGRNWKLVGTSSRLKQAGESRQCRAPV